MIDSSAAKVEVEVEMDEDSAVHCIRVKRYSQVGNHLAKVVLQEVIHQYWRRQRESLAVQAGRRVKRRHEDNLERYGDATGSKEIAELTYDETLDELGTGAYV